VQTLFQEQVRGQNSQLGQRIPLRRHELRKGPGADPIFAFFGRANAGTGVAQEGAGSDLQDATERVKRILRAECWR
jgi:hypothetical protein